MKVDILAIGVHPDDVELCCSGTLIKHIGLGYSVGLLDLTLGELGTRGSKSIRTQEAMAASDIIGAKERIQLDLGDGFIQGNEESIKQIISAIRYFQPDIVFANAKSDRHPDHGRAAKITADAAFYSGLRKIETSFRGENQMPWRPKVVYHYIQDHQLPPDLVVDVTEQVDKKMASILAYSSQFFNTESDEPDTPISGQDFLDYIQAGMKVFGRRIGAEYGEGFQVNKPIGVSDLFHLA